MAAHNVENGKFVNRAARRWELLGFTCSTCHRGRALEVWTKTILDDGGVTSLTLHSVCMRKDMLLCCDVESAAGKLSEARSVNYFASQAVHKSREMNELPGI